MGLPLFTRLEIGAGKFMPKTGGMDDKSFTGFCWLCWDSLYLCSPK